MHGGYFVRFSARAWGRRSDRTSAATLLDSLATDLPHFLLPDLLTSPPARPLALLNSRPTQGSRGQTVLLRWGRSSARVPGLCFWTDPGPQSQFWPLSDLL